MRLSDWLSEQAKLQVIAYGQDPRELRGEERLEYIRWNVLALTDELHEALRETGWKPWSADDHVNFAAFNDELVDAFHFLANLILVANPNDGIDQIAKDFAFRYRRKVDKNIQRQVDGY